MAKKMKVSDVLPDDFTVKDLVGVSWQSVQKLFRHLEGREINPDELQQWKLALGFVNATNNATKTSMQYFRLSSLPQAIEMTKKIVKNRKY